MKTFTRGDRVTRQAYRNYPLQAGTVLSIDEYDPSMVLVEWDKEQFARTTHISKETMQYLLPEAEGRALKNKLEQDFEQLTESMKDRLGQVVKLLNEASAEARKGGVSLEVVDEALGEPLLRAIETAGWNMSSASC